MYYLCLSDKNYNVKYDERFAISDLEQMIDNLVYLLQSYGIDDEEILNVITEDTNCEIEED